MGLDIYVHKTRHEYEYDGRYRDVVEETENDSKSKFSADYIKCVAKLSKADGTPEYEGVAKECLEELAKHFSYPAYNIDKLGYKETFVESGSTGRFVVETEAVPLQTWIDEAEKIIKYKYDKEVAYFRKVNFIFKYCEDKGILEDEYFAYFKKEDCEDLIDRCRRVLENHELAEELLPTRSGFFFGGTSYDDWYYDTVKKVKETFENLLPIYDEPAYPEYEEDEELGKIKCNLYIIFSW